MVLYTICCYHVRICKLFHEWFLSVDEIISSIFPCSLQNRFTNCSIQWMNSFNVATETISRMVLFSCGNHSWDDSRVQLRKHFHIWYRKRFHFHGSMVVKTPFYAWIQCSSIDSRRYCLGGKSFRMISWFYAMEEIILWMVPCTWGNHLNGEPWGRRNHQPVRWD